MVQLMVKLVYSLNILTLSQVLQVITTSLPFSLTLLQEMMNSYTDGGLHLMMCTKLGALALAGGNFPPSIPQHPSTFDPRPRPLPLPHY